MDTETKNRSELPESSKRIIASDGVRLLAGGLALFLLGAVFFGWAGQGTAFLLLTIAGLLTSFAGAAMLHMANWNRSSR